MRTERVVLRPRRPAEAIDLGIRLARANWPAMVSIAVVASVPITTVALVTSLYWPPLALVVLWWFKPLLDRPLLQALSEDLLGRPVHAGIVLRQAEAWRGGGMGALLTYLRLLPARASELPIRQLEQLGGARRRRRARTLAHGDRSAGAGLTLMSALIEAGVFCAVLVVAGTLLPEGLRDGMAFGDWLLADTRSALFWRIAGAIYAVTIVLVEPFYVGAGFGLYLNQRCRLECWDLEPALERLAARHTPAAAAGP